MSTTDVETPRVLRPLNLRRLGLGLLAAVIVNLVLYAIGTTANAGWIASGQAVGWGSVVVVTVVVMAAGGALTYILSRRWEAATKVMAWVGLILAAVSLPIPFTASGDSATAFTLAAMHVLTGVVWFVSVMPRRASAGE